MSRILPHFYRGDGESCQAGFFFYFIGNCVPYEIKTLRAGCARRNSDILPLCGIAAARKVFKPLKIEGKGELKWLAHFVLQIAERGIYV